MIGGRSWLDHLKELAFLPHASASQSSEGAESCMLSSYQLQLKILHDGHCLKWHDEDLFTCFHRVSALIVEHALWHSSSFSLAMNELCLPCARLFCLSSSPV
jgi:thiamine pyrophosphokinase